MADRTCGYCGRPLPADARRNRRFCSRAHKREALRQRRKREEVHARLVTRSPRYADATLTELHDNARPPQHWRDVGAGHVDEDLAEFSDYPDISQDEDDEDAGSAPDPWRQADDAWRERMAFTDAVEQIRARYAAAARPYEATLKRNPGVKPAGMARLEQERDAAIRDLMRSRQRAEAYERAAREAPQRAVHAAERQQEQAALNAFGNDLQGRSRRYQPPEFHGRGTRDIAVW